MATTGTRGPVYGRAAGLVMLVLIVCYGVLLIYVQVSERIVRHRTERLLATLRQLEVGQSSDAAVLRMKAEWGASGGFDDACVPAHCSYVVAVSAKRWRWVDSVVFALAHDHLTDAVLRVNATEGIVTSIVFRLMVEVPKGYGTRWEREQPQAAGYIPYSSAPYTLIAKAVESSRLERLCCYWPEAVPHPNYVVMKPGGCEGCLALWTEFRPQVAVADKRRLTDFNLDCVTRWKPCADEEDILPGAGAEYAREERAFRLRSERQAKCAYSASELGSAALNAAVVTIQAVAKTCSNDAACVKLGFVKQLGGSASWAAEETVSIDAGMQGREGRLISDAFAAHQRLIVLYPRAPQNHMLLLDTCGLLPDSERAEQEVAAGIALGKGYSEFETDD